MQWSATTIRALQTCLTQAKDALNKASGGAGARVRHQRFNKAHVPQSVTYDVDAGTAQAMSDFLADNHHWEIVRIDGITVLRRRLTPAVFIPPPASAQLPPADPTPATAVAELPAEREEEQGTIAGMLDKDESLHDDNMHAHDDDEELVSALAAAL
jgi:hypothetical protein